jgi:hypothetical protein
MNFNRTWILFGVLLVVVLGSFLVVWLNPPHQVDETYVLPSLHAAENPVTAKDVDSVTVERTAPKSERLVFDHDKETERWSMTEPLALGEYRVDKSAVDRLVDDVINAKRDPKADVNSNLKDWGLDSPAAVITLKKDNKEYKINLGKKVETKGGQTSVVYVTSSDRPKDVMAVKLNTLDSGFKPVNDFRAKELLAENPGEVQSVTLRDGKHDTVILQKMTGAGNRWKIAQPSYGEADYEGEAAGTAPGGKSEPGVRGLLDVLTALRVQNDSDFVSEDKRNLQQYGLDEKSREGRPAIEVKRTAGGFGPDKDKTLDVTLLLGKKVDDKGDQYYAMLKDEQYVVKVAANLKPLEAVLENPGSLRDRDLVHLEEFRTDVVSLKNGGGSFEMVKPQGEFQWKLYREGQPVQTADESAVRGLLDALIAKRLIKEFPDPKADDKALGLDQPAAVVSLWVDGVQKEEKKEEPKPEKEADKKDSAKAGDKKDGKKDEKKDEKKEPKKDPNTPPKLKSDKPTVKLTFGKHDRAKGLVYVRRESTGEDASTVTAAVPDSLLDKVTEGPLAYRDKTLPTFTGDATRVVLERNGQTYQLDKEKDKPDWKLAQPKEWAGRTANRFTAEMIVNDLRRLRAEKLVTEKPTPEQEQQFGLKSPRVKATVTTTGADKKPEEHVYLFGDEVKDSKGAVTGVYAREAKSDLVFTVPKHDLELLQGELRDPAVFHFDAAKAKGLKLMGWKSLFGNPTTIDLERKGGTWTVKSSQVPLPLDQNKVEDFVTTLSHLRAEKFLDAKTDPKPEKMDVKDDALHVEVNVEGEKDAFTLTVGGEAPDKEHYFADSNRLPNEFFLVLKKPFDEARAKPAYFAK